MTSISVLPVEILLHILNYLGGNNVPISQALSGEVPSEQLLPARYSDEHALKAFSRVCRNWRRIVFPILFKYVKVNIDDVIWCDEDMLENDGHYSERNHRYQKDDLRMIELVEATRFRDGGLFAWARDKGLANITSRILLYAEPRYIHDHREYARWRPEETADVLSFTARTASMRTKRYTWLLQRLFCLFDPASILLAACPYRLATIMNQPIYMKDAWAFNMKYQTVELKMSKASFDQRYQYALCPAQRIEESDLMEMQAWDEIEYHGGSCLNVYGTLRSGDRHRDHYFEKRPPCILAANAMLLYPDLGARLTTFTYRCLFPHYVHFSKIINRIRIISNTLQTLCLQLTPSPESTVLDDTAVISRGHFRLRDCWMEVERCYSQVVQDILTLAVPEGGTHRPMRHLTTFVSYDCTTPMMKEELESLFAQNAWAWQKKDTITWTLSDDAAAPVIDERESRLGEAQHTPGESNELSDRERAALRSASPLV